MFVFENFLDKDTCEYYKEIVASNYKLKCEQGYDPLDFQESRNVVLENDPILPKVINFLESKIRVKLSCTQCELQTWPINEGSSLHVHNFNGRENTDYNSLIYLNDDFGNGEFYTSTGITLKPSQGRLTFFNGQETCHGVNPATGKHRYTIIFWWNNTQFY